MHEQADTPRTLNLTVNGQHMAVSTASLSTLLRHLDLDDAAIVAEVNGAIIGRENFSHTPLRDGDQVELIRFVGGG